MDRKKEIVEEAGRAWGQGGQGDEERRRASGWKETERAKSRAGERGGP